MITEMITEEILTRIYKTHSSAASEPRQQRGPAPGSPGAVFVLGFWLILNGGDRDRAGLH